MSVAAGTAPTGSASDSAPASTGNASTSTSTSNSEVLRIFANDLSTGSLPAADAQYVAQLIAQRTGIAPAEAQKRVTETFARVQAKVKDAETAAREAADKARKASAGVSLWLFISMLFGAFVASFAATYGGRLRNR